MPSRWPPWISALIVACGIVVLVTETRTPLFLLGMLLLGVGIYGWVGRSNGASRTGPAVVRNEDSLPQR